MGAGYKGNRTVYGIWLMDEKALYGLEGVAQNIFSYMSDIQNGLLQAVTEDNPEKYHYRHMQEYALKPEITVTFSDGSSMSKETFQEIFDSLDVRQKTPQRVTITMRCLNMKVELTLSSGKFSANYFRYEVIGDEFEEYRNVVIGKIENWIDEAKPDLLLWAWYNLAQWAAPAMFLIIAIAWFAVALYSSSKAQYFDIFENEIIEIAETGITDENRDRAIELILMKQYEYVPETWMQEKSELGDKVLIACILGLLLCGFVRICPKSHFSIGKGKKKVKFWNQYRKVMFVMIPTLIIIPIIINLLV